MRHGRRRFFTRLTQRCRLSERGRLGTARKLLHVPRRGNPSPTGTQLPGHRCAPCASRSLFGQPSDSLPKRSVPDRYQVQLLAPSRRFLARPDGPSGADPTRTREKYSRRSSRSTKLVRTLLLITAGRDVRFMVEATWGACGYSNAESRSRRLPPLDDGNGEHAATVREVASGPFCSHSNV